MSVMRALHSRLHPYVGGRHHRAGLALSLALIATVLGAVPPSGAQTQLISINRSGTASGDFGSGGTWFSANGRYVAFVSNAGDLVDNDAPGTDVFVRDLQTGVTTLVSVNRSGTRGGNSQSLYPAISADGRFVAFESRASDLVDNDTNGSVSDVFVRDLLAGTTTLVSANQDGTGSGNGSSSNAVISANGRFVVFQSRASDLVDNDTNGGVLDLFIRNLDTDTTSLVTVSLTGGSGNRESYSQPSAAVSADGRYVAFSSQASNLVSNDTNGGTFGGTLSDVFVRDVLTGTTTLVSVNLLGGTGPQHSDLPHMSADGRYVAFSSSVNNLVSNDTVNSRDVFVRDLQAGTTTLVSVNRLGTNSANGLSTVRLLTPDGRFVAFTSLATDLVGVVDTNSAQDVFVRDLQTGTTMLASLNHDETATGDGPSYNNSLDLSDDGRFVVFDTRATDISDNDANGDVDVFVRDLQEGSTTLISVNRAGTGTGNNHSYQPAITADGRFVSFTSYATDLVSLPDANGGDYDVFLRALNQPPTVAAGGPYDVDEGGTLSVVASGDDPEGLPLVYGWDLDDDGDFETSGQSASFSAADLDGPTTRTITVRAVDDGGATATSATTVDVRNVAPTATFAASPSSLIAGECSTLSLTGAFDPGTADAAAGFRHSFDCTDDGGLELDSDPASSQLCRYPAAGAFTARGRIADKDGGASDYTLAIGVVSAQSSVQEAVIESVQELVDLGILNRGQGNSVISSAEAAISQLDRGNVGAALNILGATRNQIEALIRSGRLPAEAGELLLGSLARILAALEGGTNGGACPPSP